MPFLTLPMIDMGAAEIKLQLSSR